MKKLIVGFLMLVCFCGVMAGLIMMMLETEDYSAWLAMFRKGFVTFIVSGLMAVTVSAIANEGERRYGREDYFHGTTVCGTWPEV